MSTSKTIYDAGTRSGTLLFFGGVYSNLQALEALQQWATENSIASENIFCTGDILGYCAQPVECIQLIKSWGIQSIAGNVELQVRDKEADCGCDFKSGGRCDLFSRNWYSYIQSHIDEASIEWLYTLPHHMQIEYENQKIMIVHGSWFHTAEFIFASTPWQVKQENFLATETDIIIAGHCGLPFSDERDGKRWINPGVIGMPANDGTDRVWFGTMDRRDGGIHFQFHHLRYDNHKAYALMQANRLPQSYANTLLNGIWDNCEILPPDETARQGKEILL
ncbi:MAG TPA: metallophosphoesterase family protein [Flavisolibacter sp.]|nr:metallophosphoesterase family protein [Flavisolibacter sp.]